MSPAPFCCRWCLLPAVVLLNDTGLFELLFDDAHVMDFVGALEYEPGVWALYCTALQRCCTAGMPGWCEVGHNVGLVS
jgi:hypothetical protein